MPSGLPAEACHDASKGDGYSERGELASRHLVLKRFFVVLENQS
jgi:hypothetical protein